MAYFIIYTSEDGDVSLEAVTQEEVLKRVTPDEDGYTYYGPQAEIHSHMAAGGVDLQCGSGVYILKGQLVVPLPKEVVTKFEIE